MFLQIKCVLPVVAVYVASICCAWAGTAESDQSLAAAIAEKMERGVPVSAPSHAAARAPGNADGADQVRVTLADDGVWEVDLGASFLDHYTGAQIPPVLDERLQALRVQLIGTLESRGLPVRIVFTFAGSTLEQRFPHDAVVTEGHSDLLRADRQRAGVFVSASHGYYYHHGFADWRLQRPLVNGMVEDLITPSFAGKLAALLDQPQEPAWLSRSVMDQPHPQAGQPWRHMASRYHAQALFPQRPDIWRNWQDAQEGDGANIGLREYNDDIRTRPLLANEYGVRALIHLHTNAAAPSASGAMGFHQSGRTEDKRLAENLLCGMRESIQALPEYRNYRVRTVSMEGNYGENRLAEAPSALIEIGFHTNPQDAEALQDPAFQDATAHGMRKGYENFRAGWGLWGVPVCQQ